MNQLKFIQQNRQGKQNIITHITQGLSVGTEVRVMQEVATKDRVCTTFSGHSGDLWVTWRL